MHNEALRLLTWIDIKELCGLQIQRHVKQVMKYIAPTKIALLSTETIEGSTRSFQGVDTVKV